MDIPQKISCKSNVVPVRLSEKARNGYLGTGKISIPTPVKTRTRHGWVRVLVCFVANPPYIFILINMKPVVAFVCVHNSCRSQMAEALGKHFAGDKFDFYSAGTEQVPQINQDAVRIIKDRYGIDMSHQQSKLVSTLPEVDILITMGCNVQCPFVPCKHREDWGLDDPSGKPDEEFYKVIDIIEAKVKELESRF